MHRGPRDTHRHPAGQGEEHADGADAEKDGRRDEHVVHPGDRADRHDEGRDGADERPRARIDEVVVVVLDLRRSHWSLRKLCRSYWHVFVSNNQYQLAMLRGFPYAYPPRPTPTA